MRVHDRVRARAVTVPPSEAPSSGEAQGSPEGLGGRRVRWRRRAQGAQLPRVPCVEAVYGLQAVDIGRALPGWPVVPCPLHQVLELLPAAEDSGIEDTVDVVLVLTVDDNWGGWRLALAREGVLCRMLQERHVKDRVDLHGGRQIQVDRVRCA